MGIMLANLCHPYNIVRTTVLTDRYIGGGCSYVVCVCVKMKARGSPSSQRKGSKPEQWVLANTAIRWHFLFPTPPPYTDQLIYGMCTFLVLCIALPMHGLCTVALELPSV